MLRFEFRYDAYPLINFGLGHGCAVAVVVVATVTCCDAALQATDN